MKIPSKTQVMFFFAFSVVLSGCVRFFFAEGGETGLWFGLVMGAAAAVAAILISKNKVIAGHILAFITLSLVGGWFVYESFFIKGFADAEVRQLIIIAISALTTVAMLRRSSVS